MGQTLLVWNDLHEMLAFIYWVLSDYKDEVLTDWNSKILDRDKRGLLLVAAKKMKVVPHAEHLRKDIKWLVKRTNSLAHARNNTAHTTLIFIKPSDALALFGGEGGVVPLTSFNNVRAQNLKPKSGLLQEYRWYRDSLTVLRDYASAIGAGLSNEHAPWPDRPVWPIPRPKNRSQGQLRQPRSKSRPHQR